MTVKIENDDSKATAEKNTTDTYEYKNSKFCVSLCFSFTKDESEKAKKKAFVELLQMALANMQEEIAMLK